MVETTLVILTKNEIEGLTSLIGKIKKVQVDEILAIDYQSTDGTKELLKKHKIKTISQKTPGRGIAFRMAKRHSKGKYLVFFSPDGNENTSDIPKLVAPLKKGADMAIASRFMKASRNEEDDQILKFRAWANKMFTFLVKLFWGGNITDSINGFRAVKKESLQEMNLDATGFDVEFQMTIKALKCKMKIAEIPTKEGNRIGGQSTSYSIPTGLRMLRIIFKELTT